MRRHAEVEQGAIVDGMVGYTVVAAEGRVQSSIGVVTHQDELRV
jgi:hypothetical protein